MPIFVDRFSKKKMQVLFTCIATNLYLAADKKTLSYHIKGHNVGWFELSYQGAQRRMVELSYQGAQRRMV